MAGNTVVQISVSLVNSSGRQQAAGAGNSRLTAEDARAMQRQFQQIADERIQRATKYRGVLNP